MKVVRVKVCHFSTVHDAIDDRIFFKECISLHNAGYDVCIVGNHNSEEIISGIKIIPLIYTGKRYFRVTLGVLEAFIKCIKVKARIYHFHDPELLFVGVFLKIMGKKVIYDSHENVSKQIYSKNWIKGALLKRVISNCFRIVERSCIFFFDNVVSVTPEIVSFLSKKKGVLIRNFPITKIIKKSVPSQDFMIDKTFRVFYVGGLTRIRGIKEVVDAVNILPFSLDLLLIGPWESELFKDECLKVDKKGRIKYLGIKPMDIMYQFMKTADVGLVTLYPMKNYLNSLPIKSFEYMTCKMPMIMSSFFKEMNVYSNCSLFVDPKNPSAIAKAIEKLYLEPETRSKLGEEGFKLVENDFSWENEENYLISLYNKLSKKN